MRRRCGAVATDAATAGAAVDEVAEDAEILVLTGRLEAAESGVADLQRLAATLRAQLHARRLALDGAPARDRAAAAEARAAAAAAAGAAVSACSLETRAVCLTRGLSAAETERLGVGSWPSWSCPPSRFNWTYGETETCFITSGSVTGTCGPPAATHARPCPQ